MSEWKEYRFSEFVDINPLVSLNGKDIYSYVEMKDLQDGRKFCLPSNERKPSSGARFRNGDTLFAKITPCLENGKICQVRGLKNKVGFGSTEFLVFRGKPQISENDFVFYLSRWDEVRAFAESNFEGTSGRQRVPKGCFDSLTLELPGIPEQTAIASILSSFDDKIDLLHRQNKTLEQMAETLFRQWFVEEGEENWKLKTVSEIIEVRDGTHDSPKQKAFGKYLITSKHLKPEGIDFTSAYKISEEDFKEINKRSKVDNGDILFSMIGTLGLIYFVTDEPDFAIKNIGLFKSSQKPEFAKFLFLLLKSPIGDRFIHENADGSTQEYISLGSLRNFEFKFPCDNKIREFDKEVEPMFQIIKSNTKQINTLTHLRDSLLPKLMSGEVRVKMNEK
jgi:type I restriction enzyme, S subunit